MTDITQQVRGYLTAGGTSYRYYRGVSSRRAARLAAEDFAATCIAVDYFEVIADIYEYDAAPDLVADWQGNPAVTMTSLERNTQNVT